jgi:hypothetical protein
MAALERCRAAGKHAKTDLLTGPCAPLFVTAKFVIWKNQREKTDSQSSFAQRQSVEFR